MNFSFISNLIHHRWLIPTAAGISREEKRFFVKIHRVFYSERYKDRTKPTLRVSYAFLLPSYVHDAKFSSSWLFTSGDSRFTAVNSFSRGTAHRARIELISSVSSSPGLPVIPLFFVIGQRRDTYTIKKKMKKKGRVLCYHGSQIDYWLAGNARVIRRLAFATLPFRRVHLLSERYASDAFVCTVRGPIKST